MTGQELVGAFRPSIVSTGRPVHLEPPVSAPPLRRADTGHYTPHTQVAGIAGEQGAATAQRWKPDDSALAARRGNSASAGTPPDDWPRDYASCPTRPLVRAQQGRLRDGAC